MKPIVENCHREQAAFVPKKEAIYFFNHDPKMFTQSLSESVIESKWNFKTEVRKVALTMVYWKLINSCPYFVASLFWTNFGKFNVLLKNSNNEHF